MQYYCISFLCREREALEWGRYVSSISFFIHAPNSVYPLSLFTTQNFPEQSTSLHSIASHLRSPLSCNYLTTVIMAFCLFYNEFISPHLAPYIVYLVLTHVLTLTALTTMLTQLILTTTNITGITIILPVFDLFTFFFSN
ncbi:Hypothetical predicted protein [Octopus vulgaris]|uniref:Uncharacterized protein n=1 Tax=Octopus vulgaris TaxID=6645 RepID=A0AA36BA67_OCTVU|nr:Hypothetical predicted protein [Octopus vulgaris]